MSWLSGPFLAGSLLVLASGLTKLRTPGPTGAALRAAGLPRALGGAPAVRVLGLAELAVAAAALSGTPAGAGLLAVAYAGFAAFTARSLARPTGASCGCFARSDTPPTAVHLALTAAFAAAAVGVAAAGGLAVGRVAASGPGLAVAGYGVLGAVLGYLALTALPRLAAAWRVG